MKRKTGHSQIRVNMFDLVTAIAKVVDIMSPAVGNHHLKVAYLAYRIGEELQMPPHKRYELATAGALHDIGAFSLKERLDLLAFEVTNPGRHCMAGFLLLNDSSPFLRLPASLSSTTSHGKRVRAPAGTGKMFLLKATLSTLPTARQSGFQTPDRPWSRPVTSVTTSVNPANRCLYRSRSTHCAHCPRTITSGYQILEPLEELKRVTSWGALHQERLNGKGYPFGYGADKLSLGSRIMAVADVFTALPEDRPYRKGMGRQETLRVLKSMADRRELDDELIDILDDHFDEMNAIRESAQRDAVSAYSRFQTLLSLETSQH